MTNAKDARGTEREDEPEIVYVPSFVPSNYYDRRHHAIVLDERLKEWPDVHDIILDHELKHAEYGYGPIGTVKNILVELRTDIFFNFPRTEEAERVREYYNNAPSGEDSVVEAIGSFVDRLLRMSWGLIIYPMGSLYRWAKSAKRTYGNRIGGFLG